MLADWLQLHGWEALAVLLGIAYLLGAIAKACGAGPRPS